MASHRTSLTQKRLALSRPPRSPLFFFVLALFSLRLFVEGLSLGLFITERATEGNYVVLLFAFFPSKMMASKLHANVIGALAPRRLAVRPARRPALPLRSSVMRFSATAESAKVRRRRARVAFGRRKAGNDCDEGDSQRRENLRRC